jgi:acyl-CoA reductase-like NAD-dependent aldehyde dehydrogenase
MMMHKTAYVEYVPIGVLGIIAPWNYPFHNMLNHVLSGLFSGNAVMTKVSEHTSWSSVYFHNICRAALEVNGFDPELLQLCTGGAETGKALVECADVDKIVSLVHFYRIVFLCSLGTDDIWCSSLQGLQV